jgi:formate transporter
MYFVPMGLLIRRWAPESFWAAINSSAADAAFAGLDWSSFLLKNLLPVTIGNIIGGAVLVGVVYWGLYLRKIRNGRL